MKSFCFYVVPIMLLTACQSKVTPNNPEKQLSDSLKAKLTIDTVKQMIDTISLTATDTAFVVKNKLIKDDIGDKQKEYVIDIYFSNKSWPKLTYKSAIGADLFLTGDLNGDGQPELLLRPEWFSSCWASVNLFSLKNSKWNLVKTGSMYFCSDQYPLGKRVLKTDQGYALLTDSLADDKFITLKKQIKF
jgi:hypothetical protein